MEPRADTVDEQSLNLITIRLGDGRIYLYPNTCESQLFSFEKKSTNCSLTESLVIRSLKWCVRDQSELFNREPRRKSAVLLSFPATSTFVFH